MSGPAREGVMVRHALHPGPATLVRFAQVLTLVVVAAAAPPAAAQAVETFGPGKINCQALGRETVDCLLSASRITRDNRSETSFSLAALPPETQALFRKWCLHAADQCIVTVQGERDSPRATRLSSITSLHWQRSQAPRDDVAAAAARD